MTLRSHPVPLAGASHLSGYGDGHLPDVPGWDWARIAGLVALIVGTGSVGRPLAAALYSLGCRRFVLADPKRYAERSLSQCEPEDVGEYKVRCVAKWLRRRRATVVAWPTGLERIEAGWAADAVVVVCGDNLGVQRAGHEVARLLQRPFFKVNLEPTYLLANVRFCDYSKPDREHGCALCGWPPEFYALQRAAVSCDGSGGGPVLSEGASEREGSERAAERRTASPLALGMLTASWAAMTIASTSAVDGAAERLDGRDILLSPLGPTLRTTTLPPNPACPCCGTHAPSRVMLLDARSCDVSFADLARRGGWDGSDAGLVRVRCPVGQLARRARCDRCGRSVRGAWWVHDPLRPVGRCGCGGSHREVPFFTVTSTSMRALGVWSERPLSAIGVGRKAVVTIEVGATRTNFVLG